MSNPSKNEKEDSKTFSEPHLKAAVKNFVECSTAWQNNQQLEGLSPEMSLHLKRKLAEVGALSELWMRLDKWNQEILSGRSNQRQALTELLQSLFSHVNGPEFKKQKWPTPSDMEKWPHVDFVYWLHGLDAPTWNSVLSWWEAKKQAERVLVDLDS